MRRPFARRRRKTALPAAFCGVKIAAAPARTGRGN